METQEATLALDTLGAGWGGAGLYPSSVASEWLLSTLTSHSPRTAGTGSSEER